MPLTHFFVVDFHVNTENTPSDQLGKSCLSPINLIRIYDPKALNNTANKQSEIYHADSGDEKTKNSEKPLEFDDADENLENLSNIQITPSTFMNMCPALLVQIEQRACQDQQADVGKRIEVEFRNAKQADDDEHDDDHDHDHDHSHSHGHGHGTKTKKDRQPISAYGITNFILIRIFQVK